MREEVQLHDQLRAAQETMLLAQEEKKAGAPDHDPELSLSPGSAPDPGPD